MNIIINFNIELKSYKHIMNIIINFNLELKSYKYIMKYEYYYKFLFS
jgi:hypothetical protein